ncbi:MAG: MerR family transcriptional regulator [Rudaea sp.]
MTDPIVHDQSHLDEPRYRSGAAARIAKMPASTLRIWERRYNVINPAKSASGQRLYSRNDVLRLTLLKALAADGHAIGTIAMLRSSELEALMPARPAANRKFSNVLAIGAGWGSGAQGEHWVLKPDIESAAQAELVSPVDLVLVRLPSLHITAARELLHLADQKRAAAVGVVYSFAMQQAVEMLRLAGAALYRETGRALDAAEVIRALDLEAGGDSERARGERWLRAKRRYSDDELGKLARLSSTISCECPKHLADLIMQISAFEAYSDGCASASEQDVLLHRHLGDVANKARGLFESALERLAREERLAIAAADKT